MTERRYSEDEIAAIFERATEAQQKSQRGQDGQRAGAGLTLGELQQISREIGMTPEVEAQAAQSLDQGWPQSDAPSSSSANSPMKNGSGWW